MRLEEFLRVRAELRASRPALIDHAELDLYRSLVSLDPIGFAAIEPAQDPEAKYRCHVAERFLDQLGLPASLKPRTQVSHGVRRSLAALFGLLAARELAIGIPDDVYPVYGRLASEAGVRVECWSAAAGLPDDEFLARVAAVLICEPLKPWGRSLSEAELARLRGWAREDERRMLILDSAYATPPTSAALSLLHDESALVLVSLSKGWLLPDHAGLCVMPARFAAAGREAFAGLPKHESRLRIGYAALTEHADRPSRVAATLARLAQQLDSFGARRAELAISACVGYFAVAELPFTALLERGVLAIPAAVFGADPSLPRSVLSSLPRSRGGVVQR